MAKRTGGKGTRRPSSEQPPPYDPDFRLIRFMEGGNSPKADAKAQTYFRKEFERRERERIEGPDPSRLRRFLRWLTIIR